MEVGGIVMGGIVMEVSNGGHSDNGHRMEVSNGGIVMEVSNGGHSDGGEYWGT